MERVKEPRKALNETVGSLNCTLLLTTFGTFGMRACTRRSESGPLQPTGTSSLGLRYCLLYEP